MLVSQLFVLLSSIYAPLCCHVVRRIKARCEMSAARDCRSDFDALSLQALQVDCCAR